MSDPMRQSDPRSGASPELRGALDYARTRTPEAARVTALIDAVQGKMSAPVSAAPAKGPVWGLGAKLGLVLVGSSLLGLGAFAVREALHSPGPASSTAARSHAQADSAAPASEPLRSAPTSAPDAPPVAAHAPQRPRRALTAQPAATELSLLQDARRARKSSAQAALRLLDEHARRFPQGSLREEREALQIQLLQQLEPERAEQLLHDFEQRYPHSAYRHALTRPKVEAAPR